MNLELRYGIMCDSLEEQLKVQGYKDKKVEKHEKIRTSINMLFIHDYITERQKDSCIKKLHKDISKNIEII